MTPPLRPRPRPRRTEYIKAYSLLRKTLTNFPIGAGSDSRNYNDIGVGWGMKIRGSKRGEGQSGVGDGLGFKDRGRLISL
jgi:hypothetical protein